MQEIDLCYNDKGMYRVAIYIYIFLSVKYFDMFYSAFRPIDITSMYTQFSVLPDCWLPVRSEPP